MSKKQKRYAFEFFSFAVIFVAAFGLWAMLQSLSLVSHQVLAEPQIPQSVIALEGLHRKQAAEKIVNQQAELQAAVDEFVARQNGTYGIYIEHLDTGVTATHNAAEAMSSASLYKLFAADIAYQKIDSGEWKLDQLIDGERGYDLAKCLDIMITVSDNDCGRSILIKAGTTGNSSPLELIARGYQSTTLHGEYTQSSPADVASLLVNVYQNSYLSAESSQAFLDLLAAQEINDRLPQGLPDGVQIMHKTGDLAGFVHDAGIVRTVNGDYVIVVMSGPDPTIPNYQLRYEPFVSLSDSVFTILNQE